MPAETFSSSLYGTTYVIATSLEDLHINTKKAILKSALIDFTSEPIVSICALDTWGSRGTFWSVVTDQTILVKHGNNTSQNLFLDVTGVERKGLNIQILSPGNRSHVFSWVVLPTEKLVETFYQIVRNMWLMSKGSSSGVPIQTNCCIEALERLGVLREAGHITEDEFDSLKKKILTQSL